MKGRTGKEWKKRVRINVRKELKKEREWKRGKH
jgi:hypothetical protein